jgi:hypothetical protein
MVRNKPIIQLYYQYGESQEWTIILRHRQHRAQDTEQRQTKKNTTQKTKIYTKTLKILEQSETT